MKLKKDLIIVALATFCLTATLFMIKPTLSNPGLGDYDAWNDLNGDGNIDMYDAINFAGTFATSGDPTKNVNVTNARAKTVELDLNISTYDSPEYRGDGSGETAIFDTEGYDRMFISAAIIGISDYTYNSSYVWFEGVNWYWGTANGTSLRTYVNSYYGRSLDNDTYISVGVWNTSYLPVSSEQSLEFPVGAAQCSLSFSANTWFSTGWVLVRVSAYLTVGTTSVPYVQETEVTNWPYYQAQPVYSTPWLYQNTSIYNGSYLYGVGVGVGGYSRMTISIEIINCSYHSVPVTTTVSLYGVTWGVSSDYEYPQSSVSVTYSGTSYPVYSTQIPPQFVTKSGSCTLWFTVSSQAYSGNWLEWSAIVYLRNE